MVSGSLRLFTIVMLLWLICLAGVSHSREIGTEVAKTRLVNISVPFAANQGQIDRGIAFYARTPGGTIFVTTGGKIEYSFPGRHGATLIKEQVHGAPPLVPKGEKPALTSIASFTGNDPAKWKSQVPTYESITVGEVSPGITLSLKAKGKSVEKIFTVAPWVKPVISMSLSGLRDINLSESGELEAMTDAGPVAFTKPVAYQEIGGRKASVLVAYALPAEREGSPQTGTYEFAVGSYDPRYPLVIDPLLSSTFIGGSDMDEVRCAAVDSQGNVYVAGYTHSSDYPSSAGAYSRKPHGHFDVFISKLDSNLSTLLASTYIGGKNEQYPTALTFDSSGNLFITGDTTSPDYPTTAGAYSRTFRGTRDVFVSKFDSSLSTLLGSTLIGMWGEQMPAAMALDSAGNVYVTGYTDSSYYPTTPGAYDRTFSGASAIFVSKLSSGLATLLASSFVGGGTDSYVSALAVDAQGKVYIAGRTDSSAYPVTAGAYDPTWNGYHDGFVSKLDSGLSTLLSSTFLGGTGDDEASALAFDAQGNLYVAGSTYSSDYPTTPGAYSRTVRGRSDAFISKLDSGLSRLLASTTIGGSYYDSASAITLDSQGNVFLSGSTDSSDYPFTSGAFCRFFTGPFISKLNAGLSTLQASTCTPGNRWSTATLPVDAEGNVYSVVSTNSSDYPTTPGAYDRTWNGLDDTAISKFDARLSATGDPYKLTVVKEGMGTGSIKGQVPPIDCGSACTGTVYSSDFVKLLANPDRGSAFWGWRGPCTGTNKACAFHPASDTTVYAAFLPVSINWDDYFPLVPGTTWNYVVNGTKKEAVTVLPVKPGAGSGNPMVLRSSIDDSREYYTSARTGIQLYGGLVRRQYISGRGPLDALVEMDPPIVLTDPNSGIGQPYHSHGTAHYSLFSGSSLVLPYTAEFEAVGFEPVTVPAGTFQAIKLSYNITIWGKAETGFIHLAKGVGMVRKEHTASGKTTVRELTGTNYNIHDLAVTGIIAPAVVNFTKKITSATLPVKVVIQNRGPYTEEIARLSILEKLITLTTESLGQCPNPAPVLSSPVKFPVSMPSKGSLTLTYKVTFNCANDPARSTVKDPHHYDYRYRAVVNRAALGGAGDDHPSDDVCPRTVSPPYIIDPYPDATIKDKGCGAARPDHTYGNDILTDLVVSTK